MTKIPLQPSRLGTQLRTARKQAAFTQLQLAERCCVSVPTIRHHEAGRGNLTTFFHVLEALATDFFGRNLPEGETLGERIAILRKRRELSQRELASLVSCTQPTIYALEKKTRGRLDLLERVLTVLGAGAYLAPVGTKKAFYTHQGNSSSHQCYQTPQDLLERLYGVFGAFDLDPCSPTKNKRLAPVKARVLYTQDDDGLCLPWIGTVFMNPPYGRGLSNWIAKARAEAECGNAKTVVGLVPARTDTRYWHDSIASRATVLFLQGRLRFGDTNQSAPFPSALVLWGDQTLVSQLAEVFPEAWLSPS